MLRRCDWPKSDVLMKEYHDTEWGAPLYDDVKLFEFLVLEGMQAGLSWSTVLKKRENFRLAFDQFDPKKIARYQSKKVQQLLDNAGIIRNRLKIAATIDNARAFLSLKKQHGSFSAWMWDLVGGKPIVNKWKNLSELPAKTTESDAMSAALKASGFRFVGSTICYAHMQATGMVNDHLVHCFRYRQLVMSSKATRS